MSSQTVNSIPSDFSPRCSSPGGGCAGAASTRPSHDGAGISGVDNVVGPVTDRVSGSEHAAITQVVTGSTTPQTLRGRMMPRDKGEFCGVILGGLAGMGAGLALVLKCAAVGAALGSTVPGIGTAVGALIGAVIGASIGDFIGIRIGAAVERGWALRTAPKSLKPNCPPRQPQQTSVPSSKPREAGQSSPDWSKPFEATDKISSTQYIKHFEKVINDGLQALRNTPAITVDGPHGSQDTAGVYLDGAGRDFGRTTYIVCGRYVCHEAPQELVHDGGWFSREAAASRFVAALNDATHALPLSGVLHQGIYAGGVLAFAEAPGDRSYAGVAGCGVPILEHPDAGSKEIGSREAALSEKIKAAESSGDQARAKDLALQRFNASATGLCYEVVADDNNRDRYRFTVTLKRRLTALQVANRRGTEKLADHVIAADPANSSLVAVLHGTFDATNPDAPVHLERDSLSIHIKFAPARVGE